MGRFIILGVTVASLLMLSACARLDHITLGDIDTSQGELTPISVKVSEFGIELASVAGAASQVIPNSQVNQYSDEIRTLLTLINMGPRTGNPVYNEQYAENVLNDLYQQCPSGKITGIRNVREAKSYTAISGEIVRIDAYCIN